MVTRDRAENRDGPKVSGGRRGSRDPWSGPGTVSLRAGLGKGLTLGWKGSCAWEAPGPGAGEEAAESEEGGGQGQSRTCGGGRSTSLGFGQREWAACGLGDVGGAGV